MDIVKNKEENNEVSLLATIRVEGGIADEGKLKLYDAQSMLRGFTSLVNQVVHSFLNKGERKTKVHNAKGAETYITAPKKGCFEETIEIVFSERFSELIGKSVIRDAFWDYFNWCVRTSLGEDYTPQTSFVTKMDKQDNLFIVDIVDKIEVYLKHIHRPIDSDPNMTIDIVRPRLGTILRLDNSTREYVVESIRAEKTELIQGNITRFNTETGNGRLYSDKEGKILSFSLDKSNQDNVREFIVQSMKERVTGGHGKFEIVVSSELTPSGRTKKYFIHNMSK